MAVISSFQSGPFSDGGTWVGGVVPATPNTAKIEDTHTVIIDSDATLGPNGAGLDPNPETDCSTVVASGGILILPSSAAADYTWTLQGPIKIDAGGTFQIGDSFASPLPTSRTFTINWGARAYQSWIAGALKIYGCTAYHMASTTSIRARLVADVAAGVSQTFVIDVPADWSVGDQIMVGTGGDPSQTPTNCEMITITGKISATTYQATFSYNHFGDTEFGDVLIHATRNVIINGVAASGFSLVTTTDGTISSSMSVDLDINWCRFNNAGTGSTSKASAISLYENNASGNVKFINTIKLRGNIFADAATTSSYQIGISSAVIQQDDRTLITENHAYSTPGIIRQTTDAGGGHIVMGALSCIKAYNYGINQTINSPFLDVQDFTYVCDASWTSNTRIAVGGSSCTNFSLKNFKIHRAYCGIIIYGFPNIAIECGGRIYRYENGEIFNIYTIGMNIASSSHNADTYIFKNINSRKHGQTGTYIAVSGECKFLNCNWDDCSNNAVEGAVNLGRVTKAHTFINCSFGLITPNKYKNITSVNTLYGNSRTVYQNCTFVKPDTFSAASTWGWFTCTADGKQQDAITEYQEFPPACTEYFGQNGGQYIHDKKYLFYTLNILDQWDTRTNLTPTDSYEYINCMINDEETKDLWDHIHTGIITSGSQLSRINDDPYNCVLSPMAAHERTHMTFMHPVKIALAADETITLSLTLNSPVVEAHRRPKIHLYGCGFYSEQEKTEEIQTLTVSGRALYSGIVMFWISAYGNPLTADPADPTMIYPESRSPARAYFYSYPMTVGKTEQWIYNHNTKTVWDPAVECEQYGWTQVTNYPAVIIYTNDFTLDIS